MTTGDGAEPTEPAGAEPAEPIVEVTTVDGAEPTEPLVSYGRQCGPTYGRLSCPISDFTVYVPDGT